MKNKLSKYFSDSYEEARQKILEEFKVATGARLFSYEHPEHKDANGQALTTDVAWIGSEKAQAVLLVNSGLHGVEGYAGSAIQLQMLAEQRDKVLHDDVAIVVVHAVNPFGFAHNRRVNEDNIDLNRNFIDWSGDLPVEHQLTAKIQPVVSPEKWSWPLVFGKTLLFAARHGMKDLQASLQQGQYSFPEGLFYGGQEEAWNNQVLRDITEKCSEHAEHIACVDIHTGLGERGHSQLLMVEPEDDANVLRARKWWGDTVHSTVSGNSVSADVSGSVRYAFNQEVEDKCTLTMAALEFGTIPVFGVLKALAFDNWVYAHGHDDVLKEEGRTLMREAFAPRDPEWENAVLDRGQEVLSQALVGLENALDSTP